MTTIKEVARLAGVSPATVSKYLHGISLKPKNQIAVMNAIKELDYQINPTAQGLRTGKSKTIGVLIPNLENLFFTSIISSIERYIFKLGYSTIICDYHTDKKLEEQKLKFLVNKKVDGIILIPRFSTKNQLMNIEVPIVLIDRKIKHMSCDSVTIDNRKASYDAISHLLEYGHQKIGILLGNLEVYTVQERLQGCRDALKACSIDLDQAFYQSGEYTIESGYKMTKALFANKPYPTAIYATNYELTLGSIIALNELNKNIPSDISFIGFDNLELSQIVRPKLTMITQPIDEIGITAAKQLINRIEMPESSHITSVLTAKLITEASVSNI